MAGNTKTIEYDYTIDKTKYSNGKVILHPADNSFVVTNTDSQIYVTLDNVVLSGTVSSDNFSVTSTQGDVTKTLQGSVSATIQNGKNVISFTPSGSIPIPANSKIVWQFNVSVVCNASVENIACTSDNSMPLSRTVSFKRMMSRAAGGTVSFDSQKLALTVSPGVLPMDMYIELSNAGPTSDISAADQKWVALNSDLNSVAGPYQIAGTDAQGNPVKPVLSPDASLSFTQPRPTELKEQARVIQIYQLDSQMGLWRPLASDLAKQLAQSSPVTVRTVNSAITTFGVFRVTSQAIPQPGITEFFNAPNPFSPYEGNGTELHYILGDNSEMVITIYDLFGNLVRKFDFASGTALKSQLGQNIWSWDGRNGQGDVVANGGYIIQMRAKDSQGNVTVVKRKIGVVK